LILVVEDEVLVSLVIEDALSEAGYDVAVASDGATAMRTLDGKIADVDILITDIRLGGSVTGWDIARHARDLAPEIPVIYASGDSSGDWRRLGVANSLMLGKPYSMVRMVEAVQQLVSGSDKLGARSH